MAALTVCDELTDAGNRIRGLEEELVALRDVRDVAADRAKSTQVAVANALNAAADPHRENHAGAQPHDRRRRRDRVMTSYTVVNACGIC